MSRILDVYLHEIFAGQLIQNDSGALSFTYDEGYIKEIHTPLSLSLPIPQRFPLSFPLEFNTGVFEGDVVRAFFSGLLPDDIVRHRLARYLGVSEKNPFSLLEAIGGECAGALSLYPQGQTPPKTSQDDAEILDDKKLQEILDLLKRRPLLAGDDGLRLSLAGAQDKIAVGLRDDKIALIRGTTPTTHILKPMIDDIKDSVHNELFCMRLAKLVGIDVPAAQIRHVNDTPYFLVERYDRVHNDGTIKRLHQEDFCQALGIMPDVRYECEGGPNFARCQDVLRDASAKPAADQIALLERLIFNYLIGNADAHGKNFSLLYKGNKPELAPAYDLLSTAVYPDLSAKMAMKIGGKYKPDDVFLRHWHKLIPDTAAAKKNLEKQLTDMSKKCLDKSRHLKNDMESQNIKSSIFDEISEIIIARAKHIEDQIE
ncbi:MAG: type II toxin-antitoxin system HipA family toxin [Alphaproteobacteria bacterium]